MKARDLAIQILDELQPKGPHYNAITGEVSLPPEIADSEEPMDLFAAAHECYHKAQHQRNPWLFCFRWFMPVTLWLEWDANREALRAIAGHVSAEALAECRLQAWVNWRSYVR